MQTEKFNIRRARLEDVDRIMQIYDIARNQMRASGNHSQWINGYPKRELIIGDINSGNLYVMERGVEEVIGSFSFIPGPDPTYAYIEDGQWLSDAPYYVIHRVASDGTAHGIARACFEWCRERSSCLRIDTHVDNHAMRHALKVYGFEKCGIIYLEDGTARFGYQIG